jgi:hypothetical protein
MECLNLWEGISVSMARTNLTAEDWDGIKAASIRGVPDSQLAVQFGITPGAISARRFNDRVWATAKTDGRLATEQTKNLLSEVLSGSLETIATENPLLLAQYAHKKLKRAVSADALPDIESWSDAKTASEILRKACGLDKEAAQVQLNFWGGEAASVPEMGLIETERLETDWC